MYQQFFNLSDTPFSIAPDPHFLYMSEQHQEGLAHLLYGINHGGGFVALTGEVGTGKTTLCRSLLEQLPENVDIALVFNPKLNALELLASICDELQITYDEEKQSLKKLIDCLNVHLLATHANGKRTVLIIDEAQNLSLNVLEQIRLLTNLETTQTKLLQIILVGQPELKTLLEKPELRQLNQRITARYHLTPLSNQETKKYIKHRLGLCGGSIDIFTSGALKKVYKLSKGIPRLINIICDKALLGAYASGRSIVTENKINQAAKEVFNSLESTKKSHLKTILSSLVLLALLAFIATYYFNNQLPSISSISTNNPIKREKQKIPETSSLSKTPNLPINRPNQDQKPILVDFKSLLKQQSHPLNTNISELGEIWGKNIPKDSGCRGVRLSGLDCLMGKTNWENLIALNRPAILEFSLSDSEKRSALLLGLNKGQPIFKFNKEKTVTIEQITRYWHGYYLLLWQSPTQESKPIHPGQSSREVFWIRKQLALNPDHSLSTLYSILFNDELKSEVMKFQKQQNLVTDGIVGPKTFIHLQNIDPNDISPKLKMID